jgi:hypothetical protein
VERDVVNNCVLYRLPNESTMAAVNHIDVSLCTNLLAQHIIGSSSGMRAGCLLIVGARGTGKTSFATALCNLASASPRYAHTQIINCVSLFGRFDAFFNHTLMPILLVFSYRNGVHAVVNNLSSALQRLPVSHSLLNGGNCHVISNL